MNTFDAIINRRSIRQYTDKSVSIEEVEKLLKAAMYAPSAMNLQPWDFIVCSTKDTLDLCIRSIPHGETILQQAPLAIIICGDNKVEQNIDYIVQNCSAAVQNILLQAHEMGIGSCWIAVYPIEDVIKKVRESFNLPEHIIPVALVSLGYPAEKKETENRYRKEKIHYNKW